MSVEQLFLREGASYFGQRLIYRNKDVGISSNGVLTLLPEGQDIYDKLSDVTDVEVKVKAPRAKKVVVEATDEPDEAPRDTLLDELLGE